MIRRLRFALWAFFNAGKITRLRGELMDRTHERNTHHQPTADALYHARLAGHLHDAPR